MVHKKNMRCWPLLIPVVMILGAIGYEINAVYSAHSRLPAKMAQYTGSLTASGLTPAQLEMIVRVQDPAFNTHGGIEWPNPLSTTTITQSLVKRLFFADFRPGFQKIEQTLIAWLVVNPEVSKARQLEAFVDTAYLGEQNGRAIIGFRSGAKSWFNKPLAALSQDEFLVLLAMLPAPNKLLPGSAPSLDRVARIQQLMAGNCLHQSISAIWLEQCRP
jgi:monofunctional glycosyltransferase